MTLYRGGSDLANFAGAELPDKQELIDEINQSEAAAAASATDAANEKGYAKEWANGAENILVSTSAGGDGIDDYSALHHAAKASASASAASTSETNAASSETAAANSKTYAAEWANSPADTLISTAAGGDGVDDYSALHHATKASNSASAAATSETNAQTHYDNFRGVYYGALASDPTTDPNGNAINAGDWYYNTTDGQARITDGTNWSDVGSSTATITERTLTAGQTSITGLVYSPGYEVVWLNGVKLTDADYTATDGTTVTLTDAANADDTFAILAFGTFNVADTYTKAEADNRYQITDDLRGYRNVIVDGDMTSWQEGTSFTGLTGSRYAADVHKFALSASGTWTVQQTADHPVLGANGKCFEAICTTADTTVDSAAYAFFYHLIEGSAYAPLYQKTQTVSFSVKASTPGVYSLSLRNSGADLSYVAEITINAADTWEEKVVTVTAVPSGGTWDFGTGIGLQFSLALVCGPTYQTTAGTTWQTGNFLGTANNVNLAATLNNYIRITDVQLEEGDKATPFERLGPGEQLRRCQRYLEMSKSRYIWTGYVASSPLTFYLTVPYSVTKRANPNVTLPSTSTSAFDTPVVVPENSSAASAEVAATSNATSSRGFFLFQWKADARL